MKIASRLLLASIALASTGAFAQATSVTASAPVNVKIYTAITLNNNQSLNFGNVMFTGAAGTVALDPSSNHATLTATGVTAGVTGTANAATPALFTVGGMHGASYAITLPSAAITLNSSTMTLDTFKVALDGGTAQTPSNNTIGGTISATTGTQQIALGCTLHITATQADGTFTGSIPLTVAYN